MNQILNETANLAGREVVSSRLFDAPRELIFRAYVEPDHLKRWWGPEGFTNTFYEFDPRPGGGWRFTMHGPDGRNYLNQHVFAELAKPERIVLRHVTPPHFIMTITLAPEAGKTRMTWRMLFETAEACARMKPLVVPANEQNFDRLAAELKRMASSHHPHVTLHNFDQLADYLAKA